MQEQSSSCKKIIEELLYQNNQNEQLDSFLNAIQEIYELCSNRAKVQLKLVQCCYFCNQKILNQQKIYTFTQYLGCSCKHIFHNDCLKLEISSRKEFFENLSVMQDILNEQFKCLNKCSENLFTYQIIQSVISKREISMYQSECQEQSKNKLLFQEKDIQDQQNLQKTIYECKICYDTTENRESFYNLKCNCQFCLDCLKMSLKNSIKSNKNLELNQIICPEENCKKVLDFEDIVQILKDEQDIIVQLEQKNILSYYEKLNFGNSESSEQLVHCYGKYILDTENNNKIYLTQEQQKNLRLGKNSDILLKINEKLVDCGFSFIQDKKILKLSHKCSNCKYHFCINNCDTLHEGITCSDYQKWKLENQKDYREELESRGFRFCPKCSVLTERIEGCNNILCTNCKVSYCYRCYFNSEDHDEIYTHLDNIHGGYFGDSDDNEEQEEEEEEEQSAEEEDEQEFDE
ncbi:hypothetical protein ABPG72_008333 [Tetrahymena utriculariae]